MKKVLYLSLALILGLTLSACIPTETTDDPLDCPTGQVEENGVCVDENDDTPTPDTTKPVFSGVAAVTLDEGDTFDNMAGVSATDDTDGDVTSSIVVTGTVDVNTAGTYTLTYKVSDAAGNEQTATRTITVNAVETTLWTGYGYEGTVTENGDLFTYSNIPSDWWSINAQMPVENMSAEYDAVRFEFVGTAGTNYMFKVEIQHPNAVEFPVLATGEVQEIVVPLSTLDGDASDVTLLIAFVTDAGASGTIEIRDYEFITLGDVDVVLPVISGADATVLYVDETFDNMAGVTATDETDGDITSSISVSGSVDLTVAGTYTLTYTVSDAAGNETSVNREVRVVATSWIGYGVDVVASGDNEDMTYPTVNGSAWWNNNAQLKVSNFDGTKEAIDFTFTGVDGHEYLFKVEGGFAAIEKSIVGDGTEQTVQIDLSGLTEEQRATVSLFIVFVKTDQAAGTITLNPWTYGEVAEPAPDWMGYNAHVTTDEDGYATVVYTNITDPWWDNNTQLTVSNFDATKGSVSFTFTGVDGHTYIFKVEGGFAAFQVEIVADGTEQTVDIDLTGLTSTERASINKFIFFVTTIGASGTVTINDFVYGADAPADDPAWTGYGTMVATENPTNTVINYASIVAASFWNDNAQYPISDFDGTKTAVEITFTGVDGHLYLFKLEVDENVFVEQEITANGAEQVVTIDLSGLTEAQRAALTKLIFFVKTDAASGAAIITNLAYAAEEATPIDVSTLTAVSLLSNGTFDTDTTGWDVFQAGAGTMTATVNNGAVELDVTGVGNTWEPRFTTQGVAFENGKTYTITFDAKSSVAGKGVHFQAGEILAGAPYFTDFTGGNTEIFLLTTEMVTYQFTFTMNIDNVNGGILFELGNMEGSNGVVALVTLDNVMIYEHPAS